MPIAVVEASAIAAILFGELSADDVVERLGASRLATPSLLPYEIAGVAGAKVRRGEVEVPTETTAMALGAFASVRIVLHEPDLLEVFQVRAGLGRDRMSAVAFAGRLESAGAAMSAWFVSVADPSAKAFG